MHKVSLFCYLLEMKRIPNDFLVNQPYKERILYKNRMYKAFISYYPIERSVPPHYHSDMEIIIPLGVKGETIVSGRHYELINRGVHIIAPDKVHAFRICPRGDGRIFVLQINTHECGKTISRFTGCKSEMLQEQLKNLPVIYQGIAGPLVDTALGLSQSAESSQSPFDAAVSDIERIYLILKYISGGRRKSMPENLLDARIRRVIDVIEEFAHESLYLDVIAKQSSVSKHHLCRIFKKSTGMTIQAYITDLRLNRAMHLMSKEGKNVTEACYESGFESLSYFIKVFRKVVGITPKQWAISQQISLNSNL